METRAVQIVDAFSSEPLAGTPVGVLPDGDGLTSDQRSRMAAEVAPGITAFVGENGEVTLGADAPGGPPIHVAVATASALTDHGSLAADDISLEFSTCTLSVHLTGSGAPGVETEVPEFREAEVDEPAAAAALGIDVAAIRDVGADFPLVRASLGPGVLVVPVNFLEHLSGAEPDMAAVEDLLETAGVDSVYAFTFDTLDRDRDAHGIEIDGEGYRRPTGRGEACAASAIHRHGALDHDRETLRFEAGDLDDRPARLEVTLGESYTVSGPVTTSLEGSLTVPTAAGDDDIIEV